MEHEETGRDKVQSQYISQALKVHYKNIVKLVVEYSGHVLHPGGFSDYA